MARVAIALQLVPSLGALGNDPPLQPFYLLLGAAITATGLGWLAQVGPSSLRHAVATR